MNLSFDDIATITNGEVLQRFENTSINEFSFDSRQVLPNQDNSTNIFLAIKGINNDGHEYLQQVYHSGIRQFIVEYLPDQIQLEESNILIVGSSINALQQIAVFHRNKFDLQVIGITGSNGKTVVKEWLSTLLSSKFHTIKNPGSFNSQLGEPLSILNIRNSHTVGIFEAGISQPGEMENLEKIIQPGIGILTNIGSAHDTGFKDREEKIREKLQLFKNCSVLIYRGDDKFINEIIQDELGDGPSLLDWSASDNSKIKATQDSEVLIVDFPDNQYEFQQSPTNPASFENLVHCIVLLNHLGISEKEITRGIEFLSPVGMRLELKAGINGCDLIDDTYNNDLDGIKVALEYLSRQRQNSDTVLIISDIMQSRLQLGDLYKELSNLIQKYGVQYIVGIGPDLAMHKHLFPKQSKFYNSTDAFFDQPVHNDFQNQVILVKGARTFQMEKIVHALTEKVHDTTLEISLSSVIHNLNMYRSFLDTGVKTMVMVKALAYGSGGHEIAKLLQFHRVDYLGVAYIDEGISIRRNNIKLPILVLNPSSDSFDKIVEYNLEPEIFNLLTLKLLDDHTHTRGKLIKIHPKIDTGMHRLGFMENDLDEIIQILKSNALIEVTGIFTHLAAAEDPDQHAFTTNQIDLFHNISDEICKELRINPIRHILNSSGILNYRNNQFDMVRLGIGLYGYDLTGKIVSELEPISSLKTVISQIKKIQRGETVGYGRKGVAEKDKTIATIAIGYADGFSRRFGNGTGRVWLNGQFAPTIGNVCMDMTMVDITGIDANEGDTVEIFGSNQSLYDLANCIGTIPYEILTSVSERVKRVYKHY